MCIRDRLLLVILMDCPVQGLPRYLLVAQTALSIRTHTNFEYHPSILRDMMRELLVTTTVLCALATVGPHSRTNRTNRCVEDSVTLFVGRVRTCRELCLTHFQFTGDL